MKTWSSAARVWWLSIKELCRIVIPLEAARREIAVPLIVYTLQAAYLGGIMLLTNKDWGTAGDMIRLSLVFSLAPALIALIALRVGDRSVPVPLNLSRP